MIVLYGFYEEGKLTITDKNLPKIKGNAEIIIHQKSWMRTPKRVKLLSRQSASELISQMREE